MAAHALRLAGVDDVAEPGGGVAVPQAVAALAGRQAPRQCGMGAAAATSCSGY